MYEFEELAHLLTADCFSCHAVIYHHSGKLKSEWVFIQYVIIDSHLKSRTQNTTNSLNGAVSLSGILQSDKEQLCIGSLDLSNGADYRIRTYDLLITNELLYQLS